MKLNKISDKIEGSLYGALLGDAIGVPYEFTPKEFLPQYHMIDIIPPADFSRSFEKVPCGTWSDDGSQILLLLNHLIKDGQFYLPNFAAELINWKYGKYWVNEKVFDCGIQTGNALEYYKMLFNHGTDIIYPKHLDNKNKNGNGSLMRCMPCVWVYNDLNMVIEQSIKQSYATHPHVISILSCAIFNVVMYQVIHFNYDIDQALKNSYEILTEHFGVDDDTDVIYTTLIEIDDYKKNNKLNGSGYVVDSLHSALEAAKESTFEDVIRTAISYGNDTDTTACIAGSLAGARFGYSSINKRWLEILRGKHIVEETISKWKDYIGIVQCK